MREVSFLGVLTWRAMVVPILPHFSTDNIHHIINHRDAKLLFTSEAGFEKIETDQLDQVHGILKLHDYSIFFDRNHQLSNFIEVTAERLKSKSLSRESFGFEDFKSDDVSIISYTSGTSGFTKGVMLPRRSIYSNIRFG